MKPATDEDWSTEYNDLILSIKIVDDIDAAIEHINKYNTEHSDAIITEDIYNAHKFQQEVDAAAVYVNASTRFTDGFEFGFGAEIGISTQKLHARGPMGLEALTTYKYLIYGEGYIKTIRNYLQTPKGKHDFIDYSKAIILIILTTLIVVVILK